VPAPELPNQQEQAEQSGTDPAAQVLPLVQASHAAPRDALTNRESSVARNRKRAKERRARRPAESVVSVRSDREDGAPPPIAHAAPDVELAEAQLAVGRGPELEDEEFAKNGAASAESAELEDEHRTARAREVEPAGHGGAAVGEPRPHLLARLSAFLQGCWHELQRVQWPDRRQVMQATGVVIGFVIVAGLFLGASDWVSQQIVKFVLK
jgi:preprotein translocase subunit SecE